MSRFKGRPSGRPFFLSKTLSLVFRHSIGPGIVVAASAAMASEYLVRSSEFPYQLCSRGNNKDYFGLPGEVTWDLFFHFIAQAVERYELRVHAFVLMSNHFHMIASTPNANIDRAMQYLIRSVSQAIGRKTNRINHIFGGRYHWTVLYDAFSYAVVTKYVYRNPVVAGLVNRVEDYPYSTVSPKSGLPLSAPPPTVSRYLQIPYSELLSWLNVPSPKEMDEITRKAIKKKAFAFAKHHQTQKWVRAYELPRMSKNQ